MTTQESPAETRVHVYEEPGLFAPGEVESATPQEKAAVVGAAMLFDQLTFMADARDEAELRQVQQMYTDLLDLPEAYSAVYGGYMAQLERGQDPRAPWLVMPAVANAKQMRVEAQQFAQPRGLLGTFFTKVLKFPAKQDKFDKV